jgi:peptide/nickel transport system ATP-binding protein
MTPQAPLLEVQNLVKRYPLGDGRIVHALEGVSFAVHAGETVGLVGESGCGKSTLAKIVIGLVRPTQGAVHLDGRVISGLSYRKWRPLRPQLQMIFQDPYASLNPRHRAGRIIEDPLRVHRVGTRAERRARVVELLRRVGLPSDSEARYPHEFSGGQRQRIGIARALALKPRLVVADEAVSALDVSVQAQIINLLVDLQRELGMSYLFISHDLAVVQHVADRIMVMYLGRIVEIADTTMLGRQPLHPYTAALLDAVPMVQRMPRTRRSAIIEGSVPSPTAPPSGCAFHPRCVYATDLCRQVAPALRILSDGRQIACHLVTELADGVPHTPVGQGAHHVSPATAIVHDGHNRMKADPK